MTLSLIILTGFLLSIAIMSLSWVICGILGKSGWVDVVWAFTIGLLSLAYYFMTPQAPLSVLPLALIALWSLRLGSHLFIRVSKEREDGRYEALKAKWKGHYSITMFGFYMMQAAAAFLFSLPPLIAMANTDGHWGWNEALAIVIALIAIAGETLADHQLKRFKQNPDHEGQVCKVGLWRYSRHPNYFFEWVFWLSFPMVAASTTAFFTLLLAPATMLVLVLKVTGIPPTEAQAIRKRGDLYRQYQRETSAFIPWFPKK
jgi:steroid 5-alpha reductase family enzyme